MFISSSFQFSMTIKTELTQITHTIPEPTTSMATPATPAEAPVLDLEMGSHYIPKPNPSKPLGEDAHFVNSDKHVVGVADGVGGWAAEGIDAGEYARDLIQHCVVAVASSNDAVDPRRVLIEAHSRATAAGTSTACVVSFDGVYLRATNVGDSGFMIFRDGVFFYRSPVQQRRFNYPYQIGAGRRFKKRAWSGKVRMAAGDVVVVGTDGFFDNVFASEIEELMAADVADAAEDLAVLLAELALFNSFDRSKDGPFAVAARKAGQGWRGGKIDDITVIVIKLTKAS